MTTTTRPRCAWCGKLIRPYTETVRAPTEEFSLIPVAGWTYAGNHRIVARRYERVLISPSGKARRSTPGEEEWMSPRELEGRHERRLESVIVWDGESYAYVHWPFCTQRCAGEFAADAWKAGYRRSAS
jgi:hypothetical protein